MHRTQLSIAVLAFLFVAVWAPAKAAPPARADVMDQGGAVVDAADGGPGDFTNDNVRFGVYNPAGLVKGAASSHSAVASESVTSPPRRHQVSNGTPHCPTRPARKSTWP